MYSTNFQKQLGFLVKSGTVAATLLSFFLFYYYIFPVIGTMINFVMPVLIPFIIATIIAVLIEPFTSFICRRTGFDRGWTTLIIVIFFATLITTFLVLLLARLLFELYRLSQAFPELSKFFSLRFIEELVRKAQSYYVTIQLPAEVVESINQALNMATATVTGIITSIINGLVNFFASLPSIFVIVIITIISIFYFSRDKEHIENSFFALFPEKIRRKVKVVHGEMLFALTGFFRAQFILISITALITITGLYILSIDYALTMGLLTGLVDLLPVLGPGAVFVPWTVWVFISGEVTLAVGLFILYIIIIVVRQIMEPRIVASSIGLHPLATLASIFVGLKILGVTGIIWGPALLVLFRAIKKAEVL